ncbi:hypothetical protein HDU80_000496 [Chytriomyces hyalinus]|nr:hypothetical protein HDU80_000496 [Chytriomyces hyalinus]
MKHHGIIVAFAVLYTVVNAGGGLVVEPGTADPTDFSGFATYYSTSNDGGVTPGIGACGNQLRDSDLIVAVSSQLYDQTNPDGNSNNAEVCGRCIEITGPGQPFRVNVQDRCEGCPYYNLDFTPDGFRKIGQLEQV